MLRHFLTHLLGINCKRNGDSHLSADSAANKAQFYAGSNIYIAFTSALADSAANTTQLNTCSATCYAFTSASADCTSNTAQQHACSAKCIAHP